MRPQLDRLTQLIRTYKNFLTARFHAWRDRKGYGDTEAAVYLLGYLVALAVLIPFSLWLLFQLGSIVVQFLGWVFTDQPEPPPQPETPGPVEKSLDRAVPALASMVTGAIIHWFQDHTRGLPITARDLGLIWGSFASLITLGALASSRGAQIGYAGVAAATTWIAWQGAPAEARLVIAGTVALLFAVVGILAGGRVRTRISNFIDARAREKSVSEHDRERDNAKALKQLGHAAERIAGSHQAPDTLALRYTAAELDEGAEVANKIGLDSTLLPSEMAALLRTARKAG